MGAPVARVNYQREKRLKDLDRQRKQEEKRKRKLDKARGVEGAEAPAETSDEAADQPPSEVEEA